MLCHPLSQMLLPQLFLAKLWCQLNILSLCPDIVIYWLHKKTGMHGWKKSDFVAINSAYQKEISPHQSHPNGCVGWLFGSPLFCSRGLRWWSRSWLLYHQSECVLGFKRTACKPWYLCVCLCVCVCVCGPLRESLAVFQPSALKPYLV